MNLNMTIKTAIAGLTLCLFSHASFAQKKGQFIGGIKGGFNTTQISGDGYQGWDKFGAIGGVFVNTYLAPKWNIQMEFDYIMKGSKDPADPENGDYSSYIIDLDYLEIPVMFQYKLKRRWQLETGLSMGILLKGTQADENGELFDDLGLKGYDFGLQLGASYAINSKLWINARYNHSLAPISKDTRNEKPRFAFVDGSYNMGLNFTLNYMFNK